MLGKILVSLLGIGFVEIICFWQTIAVYGHLHLRISKLESLRDALGSADGGATASSSHGKDKGRDDEELPPTQELLDLKIPSTPSDDEEGEEDLLKDALATSPVPARKKNLKELLPMRKPAASQKSNTPMKAKQGDGMKKAMKAKPATKAKKTIDKTKVNYKNEVLHLMAYSKTKAVAVRSKKWGQLFQISELKDLEKNRAAASKLMGMLKKGHSLSAVLEAKAKLG